MELLLNDILNLSNDEIDKSKIEFNMQAGSGGQPFLDRWLKHSEDEKNMVLAMIVHIGAGMVNNEIFLLDSGYLVLQELPMMNGY